MGHASGGDPAPLNFFRVDENDKINFEIDGLDPRAIAGKVRLQAGGAALPIGWRRKLSLPLILSVGFNVQYISACVAAGAHRSIAGMTHPSRNETSNLTDTEALRGQQHSPTPIGIYFLVLRRPFRCAGDLTIRPTVVKWTANSSAIAW
jgi:hypothetical protein